MNMSRRIFLKNTTMQYIMTAAQYVFPMITFPYLTRILAPELYGVVTYMTATAAYFQLFIDFGFNLSATKAIAEHQKDNQKNGKVLGTVIQAKLLLLACAFLLFAAIIPFIPILRENIFLALLYMGPVILSVWLPDFFFRGIEKMEIITARFLLSKLVTTALTFVVVRSKADIFWIPVLSILGSLIAVVMTWVHIKRVMRLKLFYSRYKEIIMKLSESFIYFISTFATTAFGVANTVMLGVMNLPDDRIGFWGVSFGLISAAQAFYSPIVNSIYPHMVVRKDFRLIRHILLILTPLICIVVAALYIFSHQVIYIFCGEEYIQAESIFRALLPVLIFSFPAMIIGFPVLGVIGRVKETTMTTVYSSIFHVTGLLTLAFCGWFTILNIALLRSVTESVLLVLRLFVLKKTYSCSRLGTGADEKTLKGA